MELFLALIGLMMVGVVVTTLARVRAALRTGNTVTLREWVKLVGPSVAALAGGSLSATFVLGDLGLGGPSPAYLLLAMAGFVVLLAFLSPFWVRDFRDQWRATS